MATKAQRQTAKQNIRKAQKVWREMSTVERSHARPEGRQRATPGAKGGGKYFRIQVRDKNQFSSFRTHDVGDEGGIQRIAGHRPSGSWSTQAWLIEKRMAHRTNGDLVADHQDAKEVLDNLGSKPKHIKGDIFQAKPRPNVPEKAKPTAAQQQARQKNIKKAQAAR